jgi:hypothetical protein
MGYVAARRLVLLGKSYDAGDDIPAQVIPERKLQGLLNLRKVLTVPDKPTSTTPRPVAFTGGGRGR